MWVLEIQKNCKTKRYINYIHICMVHTFHELYPAWIMLSSWIFFPLTPCVQVTKNRHEEGTFHQKEKIPAIATRMRRSKKIRSFSPPCYTISNVEVLNILTFTIALEGIKLCEQRRQKSDEINFIPKCRQILIKLQITSLAGLKVIAKPDNENI